MYKYCGVKFSRGTGLGNRLFPWARAVIFAKQQNIQMLWPNWFHFRKASFLKGGIDYSTSIGKILLFKNFKTDDEYIRGFKKVLTKIKHPTKIKWFSGDGLFFSELRDNQAFIREEMLKIVHPSIVSNLNAINVPKIVLNIRRGKDFSEARVAEDFVNKGGIRTPLSWFVSSLLQIRETVGWAVPALVISDGKPADLKEILSLENIEMANTKTAIADLLLMSKAKVILGSGGSSFTAWGSFLSGAVTITIPGQSLQWFNISDNLATHMVTTYNPDHPDTKILALINEKL